MERPQSPSFIAGLTALILVFSTSLPTFSKIYRSATPRWRDNALNETSKIYQDEDGIATEETQKGYSAAVPKYLALLCSVLGLSASIGIAVYTTVHPTIDVCVENWLSFGTWVRMLSNPISSMELIFQ